jgi:hypothetical protein
MSKEVKKFTATELVAMIRAKYSGNAYAVLEQVAAGTGAGANSWIDAAVFSLWPSAGIWRAACEVKVSRADWLKELSTPSKNEWAREHFDYFWYVAAPGVAKDDECPMGCGLMVVRGNGLSISKQAPRRDSVTTDAWIVASFARSLDKERERFVRDSLKDAKENDHDFREGRLYVEAVKKYFKRMGTYCHPDTVDELVEKLEEVATSDDTKSERVEADHVLKVLGTLQSNVLDFILEVAPLAAHLLNARDEAAEFIVNKYGRRDECSLESLKSVLKRKGDLHGKKATRTKIAARELISEAG